MRSLPQWADAVGLGVSRATAWRRAAADKLYYPPGHPREGEKAKVVRDPTNRRYYVDESPADAASGELSTQELREMHRVARKLLIERGEDPDADDDASR